MMDELQKAAILLKHLRPTEREDILARMDDVRRERLERLMTSVPDVSQQELAGIVAEYQSWIKRLSTPSERDSSETEKRPPTGSSRFSETMVVPDFERLAKRLHEEPETVLCAVMCCLPETAAREYFESLSPERQAAVVAGLPAQRELQPMVKEEIAEFLSDSEVGEGREASPGQELLSRLVGA